MKFSEQDQHWMRYALQMADQAEAIGEVPVGAILVDELSNTCLAVGYNQVIRSADPSAHAEMIALRQGGKKLKNYRLLNTVLYVTLEPCAMCAMALVHARIKRLVYAADDPRTGACGSVLSIPDNKQFNHQIEIVSGLFASESSRRLKNFFKVRRSVAHV